MGHAAMRYLRITLHSLALFIVDFAGIFCGFVVFRLVQAGHQVAIQLPVAVASSLLLFVLWVWMLRTLHLKGLHLATAAESMSCWALAFVWNPLIFVPLHYFTQHYLTSVDNLVAMALYQAPVNLLALYITRRR